MDSPGQQLCFGSAFALDENLHRSGVSVIAVMEPPEIGLMEPPAGCIFGGSRARLRVAGFRRFRNRGVSDVRHGMGRGAQWLSPSSTMPQALCRSRSRLALADQVVQVSVLLGPQGPAMTPAAPQGSAIGTAYATSFN